MRSHLKYKLSVACLTLFALGTVNWAEASSGGRYLYDLDPYEINPKSWTDWRKSMSAADWQEWCQELNVQRWNWWRESMSRKNFQHWREKMSPADKELWQESSKMFPEIQAREEQEEPAKNFKRKVLQLKVQAQVTPKKGDSSQAQPGVNVPQPAK